MQNGSWIDLRTVVEVNVCQPEAGMAARVILHTTTYNIYVDYCDPAEGLEAAKTKAARWAALVNQELTR